MTHTTPNEREDWKAEFDKLVEGSESWGGNEFGYFSETDSEEAEQTVEWEGVKNFIESLLSRTRQEEREKVIEELFVIEKDKWNDAIHCTCMGYALIELSGGEESKGGIKMQERLLEQARNLT